ncbi:Holliday junction resolvase RuvX [Hugenholtzia roseola]|uniref:Holliday junction resolvase RuvX n=1 Tax=Hugenholtzia roseola TaxID=1002 RepID=UPI000479460A|nr:Holliday junction resolvase RuvX [Hugenholtzia roseola]
MGRILALDYGTKRVGIAVTDPLKIIATALDTIHAKDVLVFLQNYTKTEAVEAFVLGMPLKLDQSDTNNTQHVRAFHKKLAETFPDIPIHLEDERFTSKIALDTMIEMGSSRKDRQQKGNLDKISAVLILQSFMEKMH